MEISEEQKKAAEEMLKSHQTNGLIHDFPQNKPCPTCVDVLASLLSSREAQAAENAARVVRDAVRQSSFSWVLTNGAQVGNTCVEAASAAAAQFMKKGE